MIAVGTKVQVMQGSWKGEIGHVVHQQNQYLCTVELGAGNYITMAYSWLEVL